uniref:N-ethylmaleimide-sensitive factor attachment protein, alpha b n=1 Tax=Oncorhynchus tshawytscha TaxID=74940 RepID=A0AAZ3Q9Z1_ONCTS
MDNSGKEKEASALIAEAEKKLKSSQSFFGALFGGSSKMEEACDMYARAANMYKMAKNWCAAGNAFSQAARLHLQMQSKHDAATNFIDAGNAFKKADPQGIPLSGVLFASLILLFVSPFCFLCFPPPFLLPVFLLPFCFLCFPPPFLLPLFSSSLSASSVFLLPLFSSSLSASSVFLLPFCFLCFPPPFLLPLFSSSLSASSVFLLPFCFLCIPPPFLLPLFPSCFPPPFLLPLYSSSLSASSVFLLPFCFLCFPPPFLLPLFSSSLSASSVFLLPFCFLCFPPPFCFLCIPPPFLLPLYSSSHSASSVFLLPFCFLCFPPLFSSSLSASSVFPPPLSASSVFPLSIWTQIYETELVDIDTAIAHYEQAADYYKGEESTSSANKCLLKVAVYAAQLEQYQKAIEIYEQVGTNAMDSTLLKYSAKDYFFKAALCHFCVDMLNAKLALQKYEEMFPAFSDSRECKLLKKLLDACEEQNVDVYTDAVKEYDTISRLDQWLTTMLLRIKKTIEEDESDLR